MYSVRSNILVTFWTYRSLQLRPGLQFVVVMHRPHLQTSLSCRRSFGLQDGANLLPEYIFFRLKLIHKTSFEDITTFLLKVLSASRRFSWRPGIEIWSFEVHAVFVKKSSWVLNWANFSAPTCFIVAAEKFITGCHSRRNNSSEFAHILKKQSGKD